MPQPTPKPVVLSFLGNPSRPVASVPLELRQARVEEFLQARALAPKTQQAYRQDLQVFQQWTDVPWQSLTPRHITQFKMHLLRTEDGKRVYKETSVARILGTLKNFCGWLYRSRYLTLDPSTEVSLPKLPEPEANNLSTARVNIIFDAIQSTALPERNLALLALLAHGLRPGEPCGLDVGDFAGDLIHIRHAKANSTGQVPLEEWAVNAVANYLGWRLLQGESLANDSPLFVSHSHRNQGQRLKYDTVKKLVAQLRSIVGFEFHAHQFRHTFATDLVLQGVNPYHVQTLTRHKDQRSFRRYTKAADSQAAINAFRAAKSKLPE